MKKEYKHTKTVKGIDLDNKELGVRVGDLYYDSLVEFLEALSQKLYEDGIADKNRGREKLSNSLFQASKDIRKASESIDTAWDICEPYVKAWHDKNGLIYK
jgi:hypothetical protein